MVIIYWKPSGYNCSNSLDLVRAWDIAVNDFSRITGDCLHKQANAQDTVKISKDFFYYASITLRFCVEYGAITFQMGTRNRKEANALLFPPQHLTIRKRNMHQKSYLEREEGILFLLYRDSLWYLDCSRGMSQNGRLYPYHTNNTTQFLRVHNLAAWSISCWFFLRVMRVLVTSRMQQGHIA